MKKQSKEGRLFLVFSVCSQDPCMMSRAWWLMGNRGVSISKPEAVSPEDPPEAGCSPTIILLPV